MQPESKRATIQKLRSAARHVTRRVYTFNRFPCGFPACCEALTHVEVFASTRREFTRIFKPHNTGSWWWPIPWGEDSAYASNGKTYKPSEARCLALLLMAEMIRTGDV